MVCLTTRLVRVIGESGRKLGLVVGITAEFYRRN